MPRSERLDPSRPSLGPLFAPCLAAFAAVLVVEAASWWRFAQGGGAARGTAPALPAAGALVVALAGIALVRSSRGGRGHAIRTGALLRPVLAAGIAFACSALCSALFWGAWEADADALERALADPGGVSGTLVGDPSARDYGTVSVASCRLGGRDVSFRVLWPEGDAALSAGHRVRVSGTLSRPGADEGGRWNHRQGHVGMVRASNVVDEGDAPGLRGLVRAFRDGASSRIERADGGGEAGALLCGVVLGERTGYEGSELEQDFRTTGLAHLMAVSGTHLAVVTALLSWLLARTPLARGPRCACTCACLLLYVALTGFSPSALRSLAMCAAALLAGLARRRSHVLSALSLVVLVFVCASPPLAFSLGFQLSALSVAGLVALSPLAAAWLRRLLPGRLAGLSDSVAATLAATLSTLPLTVPAFAQCPLVSPLANLLAAPLVTCCLGIGIPAALLGPLGGPVPGVALDVALAVAGACAALVHVLADLPWACVPIDSGGTLLGVLFALSALVCWAVWPLPAREDAALGGRRQRRWEPVAATAALLLPLAVVLAGGFGGMAALQRAVAPSFSNSAQVVMVDVGQGDCMLVRDGRSAVLIDTGEDGAVLLRGLARQGISRLDAVYVTHKDADHCGALPALCGVVGVGHVFVHEDLLGDPVMEGVLSDARRVTGGRGAEGVSVGDVTRVGRFSLKLLGPEEGGESGNDDSLVNLLSYDEEGDGVPEARALLTGDAEAQATAPIAESIGHVDVLKVAHHGSRGGATAEELAALSPEVALIGVGADNTYGHPTRETLDLLAGAGARVYRTDLDGDIALSFSGRQMSVKLQRERAG